MVVNVNAYKAVISGNAVALSAAPVAYVLQVNGSGGTVAASNVSIQDAGGYYTSGNVEGALQEVGASLSNIDGRLTTAEGEIDTLQTQVGAIVEPQSGQGIEVEIDGSVNLGSATNANNIAGPRYLRGDFELYFLSMDGTKSVGVSPEIGIIGVEGVSILSNKDIKAVNFATPRQTLTISAGLIAWDIANGQSAKVTLTGAATLSNPTNLPASTLTMYPDLEVLQGGAGGFALSFDTNFVLPANFVAAPTTAGSITLYHFHLRSDGKLAVNYTHYSS
jgi:hypothetical protein